MKYRGVFVHLGKCAGTSVKKFFARFYPSEIAYIADNRSSAWVKTMNQHRKLSHIFHLSNLDNFPYKFTLVRNPFDRLVSFWTYTVSGKLEISTLQDNSFLGHAEFSDFVRAVHQLDFNDYLKHLGASHIKPFTHETSILFKDGDLSQPTMDFVGRMENLPIDIYKVLEKLQLGRKKFPVHKFNQTQRAHYSTYYDSHTISLVEEKYKKDLMYFNYKFEEQS